MRSQRPSLRRLMATKCPQIHTSNSKHTCNIWSKLYLSITYLVNKMYINKHHIFSVLKEQHESEMSQLESLVVSSQELLGKQSKKFMKELDKLVMTDLTIKTLIQENDNLTQAVNEMRLKVNNSTSNNKISSSSPGCDSERKGKDAIQNSWLDHLLASCQSISRAEGVNNICDMMWCYWWVLITLLIQLSDLLISWHEWRLLHCTNSSLYSTYLW